MKTISYYSELYIWTRRILILSIFFLLSRTACIASCTIPTGITISEITKNSAKISWNAHDAESWLLEYKLSFFSNFETLELSTNSYTLSNLTSSSEYKIRIKATCPDSQESEYSALVSFNTLCGKITQLPYYENFENSGVWEHNAFPSCWTRPLKITTNINTFPSICDEIKGIEDRCLRFFTPPYTPATLAASPIIEENFQDLALEFKLVSNYPTGGKIIVGLMSDPNTASTFSGFFTITPENAAVHNYVLRFSDYDISGGNKAIAFKHTDTYLNNQMSNFWLDDVHIRKRIPYKNILSLASNDLISYSINYENNSAEGIISYDADLSQQALTFSISKFASITPENGSIQDFTNPVTYITTAENGTTKNWEVKLTRATSPSSEKDILAFKFPSQNGNVIINSAEHKIYGKSHWLFLLSEIKPLIEISNFASISPENCSTQDFSQPVEYTLTAQDGSTQIWTVIIEPTIAPIGAKCENPVVLELSSLESPHIIVAESTNGFGNVYYDTDLGHFDNGQDKVYKLKVSENSSYNIQLKLKIGNKPAMGVFKGCPSENFIIDKATTYENLDTININNLALNADTEYFLMVDKHYTPSYLEKYDLTFTRNTPPICSRPNIIKISQLYQTMVYLTWEQAIDETEWEITYGPPGFNPNESGTLISENVTSPFLITGFAKNTDYELCIRSKCSDSETSDWSRPIRFKTLESCIKPSNISFNSITNSSVEISWEEHNASSWILEYKLSSQEEYQTVEVSSIPYTLSGLTSSCLYDIRLKAICENDDQSQFIEKSFTTQCDIVSTFPYIEEFSSNCGTLNCWTIIDNNNDGYNFYNNGKWSFTQDQVCYKFTSPNTADDWLISPRFDIPEDMGLTFLFKSHNTSSNYTEKFSVWAITSSNPYDFKSAINILPLTTVCDDEYAYIKTISLQDFSGQQIYIGIKCESDPDQFFLWIDNLKIFKLSSEKNILSFHLDEEIAPAIINPETHTVDIEVSNTTVSLSNLKPTISISDFATISPLSEEELDFSIPVIYTITAEDASQQVWTVNVSKAIQGSSHNDILEFSFPEQVGEPIIDTENNIISTQAKWNSNLYSITPSIQTSLFANIMPESETEQDFSNPFEYIVTAQNGNQKTWTVTIDYEENPCLLFCPFMETFRKTSISRDCWTIIDNNNDATDFISVVGKWKFIDVGYAYINTGNGQAADDWLISPKIKIPENAKLKFDYYADILTSAKFSVYAIQTIPSDIENAVNILPIQKKNNHDWESIDPISLSEYANQEIYLAIKCEAEASSPLLGKQANLKIKNFTITNFDNYKFIITSNALENGNIEPSGQTYVNAGDDFSLYIYPNDAYQINKIFANNINVTNNIINNSFSIENVLSNYDIDVSFKPGIPSLNIITASVDGGNGSIFPPNNVNVLAGQDQFFILSPDPDYHIDTLWVDGIDKTSQIINNTYTFYNVQDNHSIKVKFKIIEYYNISASVEGENGTISPEGNIIVQEGLEQSFLISPNLNYKIDSVLVDGVNEINQLIENSYTFTNVQDHHSITAKFKILENYTILAYVKGGNGSISPEGEIIVQEGQEKSFIITPDTEYQIDSVLIDGIDKANELSENSYYFVDIQENHNITAIFKSSSKIIEQENSQVLIFPNPTKSLLNITASEKILSIEIISLDGKFIDKQIINDYKFKYHTNSLAEGNYIIKILTMDNKLCIKQFTLSRR